MGAGIRKLYAADQMLRPDQRLGELPTTRELYRDAGEIAVPAVIDTVLVAMVSMMDTMMVSSLGAAAIAAVGITNQPKMIILAAFMALNVGVTAVVARRRGQEDQEGANKVLGQSLALCAVLAVDGLGHYHAVLRLLVGDKPVVLCREVEVHGTCYEDNGYCQCLSEEGSCFHNALFFKGDTFVWVYINGLFIC